MTKCMKMFIVTISNTNMNYRNYPLNEWLTKFVFFNINILVRLLKRGFFKIKKFFSIIN